MKYTLSLLAALLGLSAFTSPAEARAVVVVSHHHAHRVYRQAHWVWRHGHHVRIPGHWVYLR